MVFVSGVALLWFNQQENSWLAQLGVIAICLAIVISAIGWLGLLCHRLAQLINRVEQSRNKGSFN